MERAYGLLTKGNGEAFINENTHTSLTVGGGQAGQGYPCALVLNDQGGGVMSAEEDLSPTLRAETHGHEPCVMAFSDKNSKDMNMNPDEKIVPTIRGTSVPSVMMLDGGSFFGEAIGLIPNNSAKARTDGIENEKAPTIRGDSRGAVAYRNGGRNEEK